MKVVVGLLSLLMMASIASAQEARPFEFYAENYPYMQHRARTFTFESEFTWPEGYRRVDSASLTSFQFWMSHLPLWYKSRPVARVSGVELEAERMSCGIHLPWRTVRFHDYTIPIQLLLEYHLMRGDTADFKWRPTEGDTITLENFLSGTPIAYRGRELRFQEAEPRPVTDKEIDAMMDLCAKWSNYGTLAANAVPVDSTDIKPGDLLIAQAEVPTKGRAWIILADLVNDAGEHLYLVGTGCQHECDFHIPLFNDNKDYPWLTKDQLMALAVDFPKVGFYRFVFD